MQSKFGYWYTRSEANKYRHSSKTLQVSVGVLIQVTFHLALVLDKQNGNNCDIVHTTLLRPKGTKNSAHLRYLVYCIPMNTCITTL